MTGGLKRGSMPKPQLATGIQIPCFRLLSSGLSDAVFPFLCGSRHKSCMHTSLRPNSQPIDDKDNVQVKGVRTQLP